MNTLLQDLRYSLRQLRRSSAFALTAILTLALGIGATTAIFTLVYQVLLRSIPVSHPEQLYKIGKTIECCDDGSMQGDWRIFSYDLYRQFRDNTTSLTGIAAVAAGTDNVSARTEQQQASQPLDVRFVSGNYFSFLGVRPFAGRLLRPEDDQDGAKPVAVLSHTIWSLKFHSDPQLVGSTLLLTGHPVTIVGITAPGFLGERNAADPAGVWLPIAQEPILEPERKLRDYPNEHWLDLLVRVPNPKAVAAIEKSLQIQLVRWSRIHRSPGDGFTEADVEKQTTELAHARGGINDLGRQYETSLKLLLLVAGAVLLICCANLANLMLGRAVARRQEISVRTALGASRQRLFRKMLVESVVIALTGGVFGIAVAFVGVRAILALAMRGVQTDPLSASPSWPVLLFALAVSLLTGILFGTAPAWIASRANPVEAMRGANRSFGNSSTLPQRILVTLQAALSVTLLSITGLLLTSLHNLERQDFHFHPEGRLIAFVDLQAAGYRYEQLAGLYRRIDQAFTNLPGIQSFAYATYGPMANNNWGTGIAVPGGDPHAQTYASYTSVSPNFFETLGIHLLLGRTINQQDTATSPHVAVINKAFASKFFPGKPPIGGQFGPDGSMTSEYQVVGVVDDLHNNEDLTEAARPMFFTPLAQLTTFDRIMATPTLIEQANKNQQFEHFAGNVIVRYGGDSAAAANIVRSTLHSIDPGIPILKLVTYTDQVSSYFTQQELVVSLTTLFGILALVLACIGLYGVTSYGVTRRVPEIGLRMALGSDRFGILALILRGAMTQTILGLVLGIPCALLVGHLLQSQLFGVKGHDLATLLIACTVLALSTLIAGAIPARRAANVEPMNALRSE